MTQPASPPTDHGPTRLRTPARRFRRLRDFDYDAETIDVGGLSMAYVEAGPHDAAPVVLLHGEPTWSYLYRHMIAPLAAAGHRVLAPDFIGFGRSDKPVDPACYSDRAHIDWTTAWLDALDVTDITLFGQDWGAIIGLRLVAAQPDRFRRVFVGNGFLPTGDECRTLPMRSWRAFARYSPVFPIGAIVQAGTRRWLWPRERAAYRAPFAGRRYLAGARAFPQLLPTHADDPVSEANRAAWAVLMDFHKPFHTCFSDGDPVTRGAERVFRQRVPGARWAAHAMIRGAGHFLQEDKGPTIARFMCEQMRSRR